MPECFFWFNPPGGKVVQFYANVWNNHCCVDGQGLSDPPAVSVDHHQAQGLQSKQENENHMCSKEKIQIIEARPDHDHFDSLGDRVGFIILLLHHSGKVAQVPDRVALLTFS